MVCLTGPACDDEGWRCDTAGTRRTFGDVGGLRTIIMHEESLEGPDAGDTMKRPRSVTKRGWKLRLSLSHPGPARPMLAVSWHVVQETEWRQGLD